MQIPMYAWLDPPIRSGQWQYCYSSLLNIMFDVKYLFPLHTVPHTLSLQLMDHYHYG